MPKREPQELDLDALSQRVADLEALITSPGWALLCVEANKVYGLKTFVGDVMAIGRAQVSGVEQMGVRTLALVAARDAAVDILSLPERLLEETRQKASKAQWTTEPNKPGIPGAEMTT